MKKHRNVTLVALVIAAILMVPLVSANMYISPKTNKSVKAIHTKNPESKWISTFDYRSRDLVITPEIQALARGLKNDPQLMYEYVRNNIHFEPHPGLHRGPTRTYLDGRGGDLEQAALLVALFRAAGYAANFVQGDIQITAEQVTNWLGTPDNRWLVESILWYGGYIGFYVPGTGGLIDFARVEHYWVRVTIDGTDYDFDPSFKQYEDIPGIDLASTLGYNKTSFINDAMVGMTQSDHSLTNMNRGNIRSNLESYCSNLKTYIETGDPDASVQDIISGRRIIPLRDQPFQTSLPYVYEEEYVHEMPPVDETAYLHFWFYNDLWPQEGNFEVYLDAHVVMGSRITIYTTPGTPYPTIHLAVDGVEMGSGIFTADNELGIIVNHGYMDGEATYADQMHRTVADAETFYTFIHGWFHTSRNIIEKRRQRLDEYLDQGLAHDSEAVRGESLHIMGLNWLAECSAACLINDAVNRSLTIRHHDFGWIGSKDTVFMDTPMTGSSIFNLDNWTGDMPPAYFVESGIKSAMEWTVIDQLQPFSAVSTVKLIDQACAAGQTIYAADRNNYTSDILPHLSGYSIEDLATLQEYIDNYFDLILPENGSITDGSYEGAGYYATYYDEYIQSLITGGLHGGYGTETGDCDPDTANRQRRYDNSTDHMKSKEPVDLTTGFYLFTEKDIDVGRGVLPFRLPFTRSYSSGQRRHDKGLGYGWTFNWNVSSQRASDGYPVLGNRTAMDAIPSIVELFVAGDIFTDGLTLETIVSTTLMHRWLMEQLLNNSVNIQVMNQTWQFVELPDSSWVNTGDHRGTLNVNPDGSMSMISDQNVQFDFDSTGKFSEMTDSNGNTVSMGYTGEQPTSVENSMGRTLTFTYNVDDRLESISDGNGRVVTYTYDGSGNLTHVTDPETNVTEYIYDLPGRMTRIYAPSDPFNSFVYNEYDDFDRVIRQTDVMGNIYEYFYGGNRIEEMDPRSYCHVMYLNQQGQMVEAIDQDGFSTLMEYDGLKRVVKVTYPEGNSRDYEYDGMFREISTIRINPKTGSSEASRVYGYTYDPVTHKRVTATEPCGGITTYYYDFNGNPDRIELPEIESTIPEYDFDVNSRGQVTRVENPEGVVWTFSYDPVTGDPLNAIADAGNLNQTLQFQYNAVGNLEQITDPMGRHWDYSYDANRLLASVTGPAPVSPVIQIVHNEDKTIQEIRRQTGEVTNPWQSLIMDYDWANSIAHLTDDENRTMSMEYDDRRDLWKIYDELYQNTEAQYDARGYAWRLLDESGAIREEHTHSPNGRKTSVMDARDNITQLEYDDFDRLLRKTYPDTSYLEFTYDSCNRMLQLRMRNADIITFNYNELGQLTSKTYPDLSQITYGYDYMGQMTSVTSSVGTSSYQYDNLNRLETTTLPGSKVFEYQYDLNNNMTRLTYPDGYFVSYEYDTMNRLERIRENGSTLIVEYSYDDLSRRISSVYSNGVTESYTYDNSNQLLSINYGFTGRPVEIQYEYTDDSNIHRIDVNDAAFEYVPAVSSSDSFSVNNMNQYDIVNSVVHTYNEAGCLQGDGVFTYDYDYENLLKSVTSASDTVSFAYDGLKRCVERTVNGVTTQYLYDGFNLREIRDETGLLQVRYIYEPGLDSVVMMKSGTGDYITHRDRLGSVIALSDQTGTLAEIYSYGPFGVPSATSSLGNVLLYCGRQYDAETGLYYMRARYYSPNLGRFITPDPVGYQGGGLNVYSYVVNNPLRFKDPLGLYEYDNLGDGYLEAYNDMIAEHNETGTLESLERAKELETIRKSLEEYAKWREQEADKGGNCVESWPDYLQSGFYEPCRNLKYYDIKEIAGGKYNHNTKSFPHFAMAIVEKGGFTYDSVLAIYDPVGHAPWTLGQADGKDRQWDKHAWRDPKVWKETVLPWRYGDDKTYLGSDPHYLHFPVIPGDDLYGRTYSIPDNYLPELDMYFVE